MGGAHHSIETQQSAAHFFPPQLMIQLFSHPTPSFLFTVAGSYLLSSWIVSSWWLLIGIEAVPYYTKILVICSPLYMLHHVAPCCTPHQFAQVHMPGRHELSIGIHCFCSITQGAIRDALHELLNGGLLLAKGTGATEPWWQGSNVSRGQ